MKVSVYGAGALGSVYGVKLALHGGVDVEFVVRKARVDSTDPIVIESVRKEKREAIEAPIRVDRVSPDADVVLLAVGTEDLEGLVGLQGTDAPIVILTPMLPREWERVRVVFGERAYAAMPNVVSYVRKDGVTRYWLPPAPTRIDEPKLGSPHLTAVYALAKALRQAGLNGKLEMAVHETNPASTVCFIAIGMALAVAKSADALAHDDDLLSLTARACREGRHLARRIGSPELWAGFSPVFAAPWALRGWLGMLGKVSPEALFYAEEHFGRKLKAQHRVMIREIIDLAERKGVPHDAFDALKVKLLETPS